MIELKKIGGRQIPYRGHEVDYEAITDAPYSTDEIKAMAIDRLGLEPDPNWYHVRIVGVYKLTDNTFRVTTLDPYKD